MSFSSLFKEFKSTATWLQFPFICEAGPSGKGVVEPGREHDTVVPVVRERQPGNREGVGPAVRGGPCGCGEAECPGPAGETAGTDLGSCCADLAGVAPSGARWTCLQLDLRDTLLVYLNRRYGHLRSVRLCASLLVKNLYTSDLCFDPGRRRSLCPVLPPPPAASAPLPPGVLSRRDGILGLPSPQGTCAGQGVVVAGLATGRHRVITRC